VIGAAIRKDVWLLVRDRGALISLFVLPIVFIVAFGFMFGTSDDKGKPRPIAIWHAPGDARGAAVAKALSEAQGFVPRPLESAEAVRRQVADEDVIAGLIIPPDPVRPVELSIDLGAPVQVRGPIQGALRGVVMRAIMPAPPPGPPPVEDRTPPGIAEPLRGISSFQVTVPGARPAPGGGCSRPRCRAGRRWSPRSCPTGSSACASSRSCSGSARSRSG
jgi:hypothetical protein